MLFALTMKLLTPTGYMFVQEAGRITVALCPGFAAVPSVTTMAAMPGMAAMSADHGMGHGGDHGSKDHAKPEMPCAFSGLSALALGAVDAILLAAALAFVAALALRPVRAPARRRAPYLRPPSRGPPLTF